MEPEDGGYATTDGELDSDDDAADVELDLKLWLKQLDSPTTLTKHSSSKPKASSNSTCAVKATKVEKQTDVDFSSILGELNMLDEQFDDLGDTNSSSHSVSSRPIPPAKNKHGRTAQASESKIGDEFGDINSLLMNAISELNKLVDDGTDPPKEAETNAVVVNKQRTSVPSNSIQHHVGGNRINYVPPPVCVKPPKEKPQVENRKLPERPTGVESRDSDPVPSESRSNGKILVKDEVMYREDAVSVKSSDSRSSANSFTQSGSNIPSSGRSAASDNAPQVCVKVFTPDGSSKSVLADDCTTVGHICEILIQKNLVDRSRTWGITEQIPDLFMQRILEDHLYVLEETRGWLKQSTNRLVFLETPKKYNMFDKAQILDEDLWEQKELEGWLHLKSDGKKAWKKWNFFLRTGGIFYNCRKKKKVPTATLR